MRLQVRWKLNLPPFGTQLVLTNFCYILNSCHFFKDCTLLLSPLHWQSHHSKEREYGKKIMYWLLTALLEMIYVPSAQIALVWTSHMTKSNPMGVGAGTWNPVITEPNLGPLAGHLAKPVSWYLIVVKGITAFISGHQTRGTGSWCSKDPNFPVALRQGFLKATLGWGLQGVWSALERFSNWLVVR